MFQRFALALLFFVAMPTWAQALFQEGKNFIRLAKPVPVATGQKIEVLEIFSYACIHCYEMEPHLSRWNAVKPANAELRYVHAAGSATWELFARGFYAAEALKVKDKTHAALFQENFVKRAQLSSAEKIADFYARYGVDRAKFLATMTSFGVNTKVNRGNAIMRDVGVDSTPAIVVDGKFLLNIDRSSIPSFAQIGPLINFVVDLAAKERVKK